jgi:hypothetical protein
MARPLRAALRHGNPRTVTNCNENGRLLAIEPELRATLYWQRDDIEI